MSDSTHTIPRELSSYNQNNDPKPSQELEQKEHQVTEKDDAQKPRQELQQKEHQVTEKDDDQKPRQELQQKKHQVKEKNNDQKQFDIKNFQMKRFLSHSEDIVYLNVGGKQFVTLKSTLNYIPNTVLALLCSPQWEDKIPKDENGHLFLDCDPIPFRHLLSQLREWSCNRKSKNHKKVFDLPSDDPMSFQNLCRQLSFDRKYVNGIYRQDQFNKVCGNAILKDNGLVATQLGNYHHYCEIRGTNFYSTGIHRLLLKIEHQRRIRTLKNQTDAIFIGIIWSSTPMQERSFDSPTAYGWTGQKQVYLNGIVAYPQEYGGWDSDLCLNDTVELIMNCNEKKIQLFNQRTNKVYEIIVDTVTGCPFPWQLHINLYYPDDLVRILS
ncbi:unnamed protein product [Didymodactylos carnosus]|uniref:Potassium channel tetramerisation-type BTB domain-containing protein n=1 Tax=Didymodactylos carnosus TaxID=1234261 RepID=A0A815B0T8_9BILA|nr:unnamed protein product [Didymodactylos carnosus]CAF1261464.1 unnamed protein product [Didymodactylos carnosus]CAF3809058.1 unnamed protein product [Didymodactylos carnosus]CAF4039537.1 unnamed protein product [Didymodactylos carnosus]